MAESQREFKVLITADANRIVSESQRAALGLQDMGKEGVSATEGITLKQAELKKLVAELSREFPELGSVAQLALNPVVFTASSAILLFAKAKQLLQEWNAELDAVGQAASRVGWNLKEALADLDRNKLVNGPLERSGVKELATQMEQLVTQANNATAALNRQANAMVAIRDSRLATELARIDAAVAGGKMSELDALEAKNTARVQADHEKRLLAADQSVGEADIKSGEAGKLVSQIYELQQQLNKLKAGERERQALLSEKGIPAELADEEKKLADLNGRIKDGESKEDAARAVLEKERRLNSSWYGNWVLHPSSYALYSAQKTLDQLESDRQDATRQSAVVGALKNRQARLTGEQQLQSSLESEIGKRREQAAAIGADVVNLRASAVDQRHLDSTLTADSNERATIESLTAALRQKKSLLDSLARAAQSMNGADQAIGNQMQNILRRINALEIRLQTARAYPATN